MVQEARIQTGITKKKPKLLLDKSFSFINEMTTGDRGQMPCSLEVTADYLEPDEDGNEFRYYTLMVNSAEYAGIKKEKFKENNKVVEAVSFSTPLAVFTNPKFDICETEVLGLTDKKLGNRFRTIIGFRVMERTKSYALLKVESVYIIPRREL